LIVVAATDSSLMMRLPSFSIRVVMSSRQSELIAR
jgi:hypothetical protein